MIDAMILAALLITLLYDCDMVATFVPHDAM